MLDKIVCYPPALTVGYQGQDSCTGLKIIVMAMLKVNIVIRMCGSPWRSCDGFDLIES